MSLHTESCLICGGSLEYLAEAANLTCALCGREERGHVRCPGGHYVCEKCHGAGFLAQLPALLEQAGGGHSPFVIAERLMGHPDLPMLGCEHAHIAAGALVKALIDRGDLGVTPVHLAEALERTGRQAVSAYCGLSGVCGVVPALGAVYSVLVGGQCGRGPETRATMHLVARLAEATAEEAEPGCCKAYVRRGLAETAAYLEETLGIGLPAPPAVVCPDVDRHPHGCRGSACSYHPEHSPGPARGEGTTAAQEVASEAAHPTAEVRTMDSTASAAQARYDDFFSLAYADGALDARTKILVSLGASLAAGCAP